MSDCVRRNPYWDHWITRYVALTFRFPSTIWMNTFHDFGMLWHSCFPAKKNSKFSIWAVTVRCSASGNQPLKRIQPRSPWTHEVLYCFGSWLTATYNAKSLEIMMSYPYSSKPDSTPKYFFIAARKTSKTCKLLVTRCIATSSTKSVLHTCQILISSDWKQKECEGGVSWELGNACLGSSPSAPQPRSLQRDVSRDWTVRTSRFLEWSWWVQLNSVTWHCKQTYNQDFGRAFFPLLSGWEQGEADDVLHVVEELVHFPAMHDSSPCILLLADLCDIISGFLLPVVMHLLLVAMHLLLVASCILLL